MLYENWGHWWHRGYFDSANAVIVFGREWFIGGIISRKKKVSVWKRCWWGIKGSIMISKGVKQENSRAAWRCMIVMWWLAIMYFDWDTCAEVNREWNYMEKKCLVTCPAGLVKEQWSVIRPVASCTQHSIIWIICKPHFSQVFLVHLMMIPFGVIKCL